MILAHLSDLHLDGEPRASERADRVVRFLEPMSASIDAILVTGDIADHGRDAEYEEARALLDRLPGVLVGPGNHDDRTALRRVLLGDPAGAGPINHVQDLDGLRIAMCDSSIPGRDDGYLDDDTLTWLDAVLAEAPGGVPTVVAFHHPPVALHSPFIDDIRQRGAQRLADVIGRHPSVLALLCGHAHTAAATTFAGRPVIVAPGVTSTLRLPWEDAGDIDESMPPGLAFHVVAEDASVTTHFRLLS